MHCGQLHPHKTHISRYVCFFMLLRDLLGYPSSAVIRHQHAAVRCHAPGQYYHIRFGRNEDPLMNFFCFSFPLFLLFMFESDIWTGNKMSSV
ncbi:uncharacterized protein BO66DRAFT_48584 [Aspergillus aculeatinus CBS 121060]|uniref:Uncharacterized protein n=1 Tax=Aspergillus aculeatinus CBS 121060 TaxID=1448322 RepID=A0ACD1HDW2_9EURO|nr:hypothetical protein BO66DRAFT_48584 [Aspergillus aculeatinus CBS 121060]RAH71778.1 hypothetical protein BO66DRAFT_48584 [Aspergillus aculeatinus CBS 121060]